MADLRVLVVIASTMRRGAELEGIQLAQHLGENGMSAKAIALASSTTTSRPVDVDVLGSKPLGIRTLRALRHAAQDVDVVIAYGSTTLPACAIGLLGSKTPFVYRSIGDPAQWVRGRAHRLRTAVLFHRATRIVALWPAAAASIGSLYRTRAGSIDVIANARDRSTFAPPSATERATARGLFGFTDDDKVAALVGALTTEKRPALAIEAVVRLDGVHLVIAGDGPLRHDVEQAASHFADRVHLVGTLDDVRSVLHAADVVISTSGTEGMPGSLIEARFTGLPIVATNVGAVADVIGPNNTLLDPEASITQITEAIRVALDRDGQAPDDGIDAYTWATVIKLWKATLYQAHLGNATSRRRRGPSPTPQR